MTFDRLLGFGKSDWNLEVVCKSPAPFYFQGLSRVNRSLWMTLGKPFTVDVKA